MCEYVCLGMTQCASVCKQSHVCAHLYVSVYVSECDSVCKCVEAQVCTLMSGCMFAYLPVPLCLGLCLDPYTLLSQVRSVLT